MISIRKFKALLFEIIIAEKQSYFSWIPVLLGIGICIQPLILDIIPLKAVIVILIILLISLYKDRSKFYIFCIKIILVILISGIILITLRINHIQNFPIKKKIYVKDITAKVDKIKVTTTGKKYIISNIHIKSLPSNKTPKKIYLNIRTNSKGIEEGDLVSLDAVLFPPPEKILPEGYDFSTYAFFEEIGALGFATSDIHLIKKYELSFNNFINHIRSYISGKIFQIENKNNAAVIAAMLIGERGNINKKDLEALRHSNIAHLLAISGMHMTLVVGFFFIISRSIFACYRSIALKYNTKKIAAYISIVGSLIYLLIAGMPISAQRAFIMIFLILLGIILERFSNPIRSISIAAIIVIIITPESIFTASFQMSFAATLALVSFFSSFTNYYKKKFFSFNFINKIFFYFSNIIFSSTVAGIATIPFVIFHFNQYSNYGILANLVAIPITSFYIMPLGVISLLLMPIHLQNFTLELMSYGVDIIIRTAHYINTLPKPYFLIPHMPSYIFAIFILSGLWLFIFQSKIRFIAIIPIILAIFAFMHSTKQLPDLIIDSEGILFAIKNDNNGYDFSTKRSKKYIRNKWLKYLGKKDFDVIKNNNYSNKSYLCNETGCTIFKKNYKATINKLPFMLEYDCKNSNFLINLTFVRYKCDLDSYYINKYKLKKYGTHFIFLHKNNIIVKTSNN